MQSKYTVKLRFDDAYDKGFMAIATSHDTQHSADSGWCETTAEAYKALAETCFEAWLWEANQRG